jgi:hypothetical protein
MFENYLAFQSFVVPDEGYSRNASCTLNLISVLLLAFCARCKTENKISPKAHTNELYIHHIVRTLHIFLHRSLLHITNYDCSTSN